MNRLPDELWRFVCEDPIFGETHEHELRSDGALYRFLYATMDEVRLWNASYWTRRLLEKFDIDDAEHFRQGVLRREVSGLIGYSKQRDHSAHTLHNFLFGWYLYCNTSIATPIRGHLLTRGSTNFHADFASAWPFVSLLHDIGYVFEGAVPPLSASVIDDRMKIGAEIAHDYFSHRLWTACGFDSTADRRRLGELSGVDAPDFTSTSLAGIADALRSVGNLNSIWNAIIARKDYPTEIIQSLLLYGEVLPSDAFDLWETHYGFFGQQSMASRFRKLRSQFENVMLDGLGGTGLRVLDHGVAGGLLLLLYVSFYFRVHFGLKETPPVDPKDAGLWQRFRHSERFGGEEYEAWWWWSGLVWATGATALHNLQEQGALGTPLSVTDDALAYLGIMVDLVQEWDRYTVSRESVVGGRLPLQSVDVHLSASGGIVRLGLPDRDRVSGVIGALNRALVGWENFLDIYQSKEELR